MPHPPALPRRQLPSLLTPGMRRLLWFALAPAMFLLANTVYLVLIRVADVVRLPGLALGETSLPVVFQAMVLSHTGAGILVTGLLLTFLVWHLPAIWARRHRASIVSGVVMGAGALILLISGLYILTEAASLGNRWIWWLHVGAAAAAPAAFVVHRFTSHSAPARPVYRRNLIALAPAVGILLLLHAAGRGRVPAPGAGAPVVQAFDSSGFVPAGFVDPAHPFFPSPATTASGDLAPLSALAGVHDAREEDAVREETVSRGFATSQLIGAQDCERCHQDIVNQWAASAHRFASFNNPFYEASVRSLRDTDVPRNKWIVSHAAGNDVPAGVVKSKWCAGCHDPALLLTGRMGNEIDRGTVAAQAGLTCTACHRIDVLHDQTGNANYQFRDDPSDPYVFSSAAAGTVGRFLHDAAVKAKPSAHRRRMLSPVFRESAFCATCHKVSLTEPVNDYRWVRGQNEFDNWDDSGVALNAARTFYLPPTRRNCQDCHMPPEPAVLGDVAAAEGMVRSHRFLAANTALPFLRGDTATLRRTETFLRDEKLSTDLTAVTVGGDVTMLPAQTGAVAVPVGVPVVFDVVVRNRGVGHTFPGGTNDSNEGWLELAIVDDRENVVAVSGELAPGGFLDPMAHVFKAVLVDARGNPIHARNAQDIRATVFANVIPPGNADLAHYRVVLPEALRGQRLHVRVRLRWRKFDRAFTGFSFDANRPGFPAFDSVPVLPVTDIAGDTLTILAGGTNAAGIPGLSPDEWGRANDYGIALLGEGNTRAADRAFNLVAQLQPNRIDGPLNQAKVALRDGDLDGALAHVARAEAVQPGDARVAWVWAVALQEDGQYGRAVTAYRRVLESFPGDRATWRNLGRTYYLDFAYEEALDAFARVLGIDPEDRIAHLHRLLIFRAQGRAGDADRAEAAADYYSIDEAAQELTRVFRAEQPGANLMAQPVRVHEVRVR